MRVRITNFQIYIKPSYGIWSISQPIEKVPIVKKIKNYLR